jgi:hypothetical protein
MLNNTLKNISKMNIYICMLIICGLGTLILPFFIANEEKGIATRENNESQNKLKAKIQEESTKNQNLTIENLKLSLKIEKITNESNERSKSIDKRTEIVHDISKETNQNTDQIIGKGSYPFATWTGGGFGIERQIIVSMKGEYAIPNLEATVNVIDDYSTVNGTDMRVIGIYATKIKLGLLRKFEGQSFTVESKTKETYIGITFKSDNYTWHETILIKNHKALWIVKDDKGSTLEKYIDKDFPLNKKGEIVLWSNVSTMPNDL